jgi:hypothetical protein
MVMEKGYMSKEDEMFKDKSILAFIIDGEVVDTFVCDERFSSILQSQPTIVEINKDSFTMSGPYRGWLYDGKNFYPKNQNYQY